MTLALLGGTFDPVHIGHLFLAHQVREEFGYDRVVLVPAHRPPHKETEGCAAPAQRLAMLERSLESMVGLEVDACELGRGGVSYTVDTLADIVARRKPRGLPGLILGDDLVEGFASWKEPERVARISDLIIAHRRTPKDLPFPYPHRYAHNWLLGISSTDLRARIRSGLPVGLLLPAGVLEYIRAEGLYGATGATR